MTVLRCVCLTSLLTTAAWAQPREDLSPVFGASIVDVALSFDDAARQSLVASRETDVPARMTFKDASGVDRTYEVQIHIKGQSGSKRSLGGKPALKVKLGKNDRFFGLEHLTLNNMVQDATMLHEAVGYQVYEAAGVSAPATGYVRLTVNGRAYGLYLNLETPDAHFLKRRFGDDSGIVYEGAYGVDLRTGDVGKFELHEGADPDRARLKALVGALDSPGDDLFYGAAPQVDTASFLGMMAAEALLGDWDSYYTSNNYRIYWNPSARRWFFIPTGIDQSFKGTAVFGATGLLFQKCLASVRCTKDYADKVRDVADRFERLDLPARMDALLSVIDAASEADPKNKNNAATMAKARHAMRTFIAKRPDEVRTAISCLDGGQESTLGACAGAVAVNAAANECAEAASSKAARDGAAVRLAPCRGIASQRWRLVAKGEATALASVSSGDCLDVGGESQHHSRGVQQRPCADIDSQRFLLRPVAQGTQLVATHSGKCIAAAPRHPRGAALIQVTCDQSAAQTWRMQRSIYE